MVKSYVYKLFQGTTDLGNLDNVISDFAYSQDINSAGAQLIIELGNKFDDVGAVQTDTFWVDEAGNHIADEAGNRMVFAKTFDFNNIPIDLANRVKVYMFDDQAPNGTIVFDGLISKWGTQYKSNVIRLTVLSYGVQLANYVIASATAGTIVSQLVQNTTHSIYTDKGQHDNYAQSFNLVSQTLVGSISVYSYSTGNNGTLYWTLYSGTPTSPGSLLDAGSSILPTTAGMNELQFTTPLTLPAGDYHILYSGNLVNNYDGGPVIGSSTTAPYAGGKLYYRDLSASPWTDLGEDLTFTVNISTGSSAVSFTSIDPGQIARTFMTQMQSQGAIANYTNSTIDVTNTTASYDFKIATGLDGIQKALSLAPDGWYWYYDMSTNYVHFHQAASTATHTLVLGKHFKDANIVYSLETVVNSVYFSGGDTGSGDNLYSVYTSASSISNYGKWTELLSDNRVTLQATADTIANNELATKQGPLFQITIEIVDGTYDIESFTLGQMVQFRNFNNLLDTELFQIVRIERNPNSVILLLGDIPPRASAELQETKKRLDALETVNNPNVPT